MDEAEQQDHAPLLSGVRASLSSWRRSGRRSWCSSYGVTQLDWEHVAGGGGVLPRRSGRRILVGRLGFNGTAEAFVEGFSAMAFGALLIGFARAIYIVLSAGHVVDTLVAAMFAPLGPPAGGDLGRRDDGVQTILHFPVPSVSGQAVLTMPILVPLADLLGLPRQVVVLAYQYGAGLCELMTPTNGALMAILSASKVRFSDWLRFTWPLYLALVGARTGGGAARGGHRSAVDKETERCAGIKRAPELAGPLRAPILLENTSLFMRRPFPSPSPVRAGRHGAAVARRKSPLPPSTVDSHYAAERGPRTSLSPSR